MRSLILKLSTALAYLLSASMAVSQEAEPQIKADPMVHYRHLHLLPNTKSVFHKEEHQDTNQHVVANLKLKASESFDHFYLIEGGVRTKRSRFDDQQLEMRLEQAFIQSKMDDVHTFAAGKIEEIEGPGALVNPSDILNEDRRLYDSLYFRYGKMQMKWNMHLGDSMLSLSLLPRKGQEFHDGDALVRYSGQLGSADFAVKAKYSDRHKWTHSVYATGFVTDAVGLYAEARYQSVQRDATEQRETQFASIASDSVSGAGLVGMRYVLAPQRSLIGEYFHNQAGLDQKGFEQFFAMIAGSRDADRETDDRLLGQDYAVFGYFDEVLFRHSAIELSGIMNLQDESAFINLKINRQFSKLTSIELNQLLYQGKRGTEFGEMPFAAIMSLGFVGQL